MAEGEEAGGEGEAGAQEKPSRAPKSVRDTLGGRSGRKGRGRRKGGSGPRPRQKAAQAPRGAREPSSEATTSRGPRITTTKRCFPGPGGEWTARLEGSSAIGSHPDPSARLLSLSFEPPSGAPAPAGTAYVAAMDLGEPGDDTLLELLQALRAAKSAPPVKAGQTRSGKGRGRPSRR